MTNHSRLRFSCHIISIVCRRYVIACHGPSHYTYYTWRVTPRHYPVVVCNGCHVPAKLPTYRMSRRMSRRVTPGARNALQFPCVPIAF